MSGGMLEFQNLIDGKLVAARSGRYLEVFEPATGKAYAKVPDSDASDVEAAYQAAAKAFPAWAATPADARGRILWRIGELIERDAEALVRAESQDQGKPVKLARTVDLPRAALNFRFFAGAATQFASESHAMESGAINYTLRQPLGVVACISPWNLPLYLLTWKLVPALAAGNCVVAKPSEVTPHTAWLFAKLCIEAGLPPGVLNIIHGTGQNAGTPLVDHPGIKAVSFTGGTATGGEIAKRTAPRFKKLSLELGGKNATIVFADCDYEVALGEAARAAFQNQGEICTCGSRILVEKPLYERFLKDLVVKAEALKVGDPSLEATDQGAIVSKPHFDKIMAAIATAKAEGGRIECGGEAVKVDGRCAAGHFIAPTVISGLGQECRTNQEEIFGPVVTVQPFDDEADAVAKANGVRYGLGVSVWTNDVGRTHRMARTLEAGLQWFNCWMLRDLRVPMGGMKDSGVGREGGFEAMRFFTEPKTITVKHG
jgi:aminomuconate-semialdehyde/2-hydroxymuconate-6-semialdehyde dehydrogenase